MTAASVFVLGALFLAQAGAPPAQAPMKENRAPVPASPAPMKQTESASVDHMFAIAATEGNNAELEFARLAVERGSADEIKAFASKMIAEHEGLMNEMRPALGALLGLSTRVPRLAVLDQLTLRRLQAVSSPDFDQAYALQQIGGHLAMMTVFQTEVDNGADPPLKEVARKWLPTIKAHLALAVNLTQHIGGASPFKSH